MNKVIAKNKKAYFDYHIDDKFEAGLVLKGLEVKSARAHHALITGAYIKTFQDPKSLNSELWLVGSNFSDTEDASRHKKLLLNKQEIKKLTGKLTAGNATIVPLELYFKHGVLKVLIGLGSKIKKANKKDLLKQRDIDRDVEREFKDSKR